MNTHLFFNSIHFFF